MPIVTQCSAPGCETLTIGPLCVEHEPKRPVLVQGRPSAGVSAATTFAGTRTTDPGHARRPGRPGFRRAPQPVAKR